MTQRKRAADAADLSSVAHDAIRDVEKLIGQHFDLLRSEILQEFDRGKTAAQAMAAGAGLAAGGGVLGTLAVVHGLHKFLGLPLWSCYGLVGGAMGVAGAKLLAAGREQAADIRLIPPRTARVLKEDVQWLEQQAAAEA